MADGDRPARSTRFKPGRSGNPKGRPKRVKESEPGSAFDELLGRQFPVRIDGYDRQLTADEALVHRTYQDALAGELQPVRPGAVGRRADRSQIREFGRPARAHLDGDRRLGDGAHLEQYCPPAQLLAAPANDFVAEFVGTDRELKRLAVTPIPRDTVRPDTGEDHDPTVPIGATLREALIAILESRDGRVRVVDDGKVLGSLTAADIHAALRTVDT